VGDYTRVIAEDYDLTLAGWWLINIPSPGTVSAQADSKKSLVIRDIIKTGDPRSAQLYFNSLDTQVSQTLSVPTVSTEASQISILSYRATFNVLDDLTSVEIPSATVPLNILDSRYLIRAPKLLSDTKTAGDTVGVWLNTIKTGAPLSVYEPTALDLTFVDINDDQKLIDDVWDGFLQTQAVPDGLGKFYIPSIGDTVQDAATSNSAEVAYVKVIAFNILQIYIKESQGL
jgi:hypothetical protein